MVCYRLELSQLCLGAFCAAFLLLSPPRPRNLSRSRLDRNRLEMRAVDIGLIESCAEEIGDFEQGHPAFREHADENLPNMGHTRKDAECACDTARNRSLMKSLRVVEQ